MFNSPFRFRSFINISWPVHLKLMYFITLKRQTLMLFYNGSGKTSNSWKMTEIMLFQLLILTIIFQYTLQMNAPLFYLLHDFFPKFFLCLSVYLYICGEIISKKDIFYGTSRNVKISIWYNICLDKMWKLR